MHAVEREEQRRQRGEERRIGDAARESVQHGDGQRAEDDVEKAPSRGVIAACEAAEQHH
jgi:hypothetical protein